MSTTDVLISGGGTGGHVFPALALADELVARGYPRERIRFVGAARGLEATAVPAAGYEIDLLPGRGFERSASAAAIGRNLRTTADTVVAGVVGACDGELTVGQILAALADLLDLDPDESRATYLPVVSELVAEGFLVPQPAPSSG